MSQPYQTTGISASQGVAIGAAVILQKGLPEINQREIEAHQVEDEIRRFNAAFEATRAHLRYARQQIPPHTERDIIEFIDSHLLMLEDNAINKSTITLIRDKHYAAEWALQVRRNELTRVFDQIDDPYLRTRKDDVNHVIGQLQFTLCGVEPEPESDLRGRIVVARDLTPAETIMMKNRGIAAFITEYGGALSHTSILARSLQIPAVAGVHKATHQIEHGETVIVDGTQGVVLSCPTADVLAHYQNRIEERKQREEELRRHINLPAFTVDGQRISLQANIELMEDITTTLENRADGVGLYRTEFLYMNRDNPPTEDEQFEAYASAVQGLNGIPLTIRTLDLGLDKTASYQANDDYPPVVNPALGLRAIRLCLKETDLFIPQLRAILRASALGPVRLMIPMLSRLQELNQALRLISQTKNKLRKQGFDFDQQIPIGGMIEIPAAALAAPAFARRLDFFSIGTNDLIQYTLAVDRMDEDVNFLFDPLHPSVLFLIRRTIEAANKSGIPVNMCGEMAGDPRYIRLLLGMGLRELSMQPSALLEAREVVRECNLGHLRQQTYEFFRRLEHEDAVPLFSQLFDEI